MKLNVPVKLMLLIMGLSFTAIGVLLGPVFGKPILDQAKASEQWPQTDGEILESELETRKGEEGGTLYSAHVVYRYALDGGEFESNRIWFGGDYATSDRSEMFEIVKQYPVGKQVTVYYSPDKPSEAVLMPGAYLSSYILYVIGMVLMVVGAILLLILVYILVKSVAGIQPDQMTLQDSAFDEFDRQFSED